MISCIWNIEKLKIQTWNAFKNIWEEVELISQKEKGNEVNEFIAIYPSENVTVKCLSSLSD